jgi:ATP-dependent Clp protease ATP-binding subunit ClpA
MTTDVNTTQATLEEFRVKAKEDIFGQDAAIDALAAELSLCFANRSDERPLGVFVLAGPDVNDKAGVLRSLAAALGAAGRFYDLSPPWGGEDALILGMNPTLPRSMSLQQQLRDRPRSVIILKAVELAHPTIVSRLMSAWTSNRLQDPSGEEVSTREAIFILTTELAQGEIGELARHVSDPDRLHVSAVKLLADAGFPIPVLRSVDAVVCLKRLTVGELTRHYCQDLADQVSEHGLVLEEDGLDARLVTHGLDPVVGAYAKGTEALLDRLDVDLARVRTEGIERVRLVLGEESILVLPVDRPLEEDAALASGNAEQEVSGDE